MTKTSFYITNSLLTWVAFVFLAYLIMSIQNSTNAFWSVDLESARDLEERGCFSRAQSGYDVSFGLAKTGRDSAETFSRTKYIQNSEQEDENADDVYASEMENILNTFNSAVRTAEAIANDAVSSCERAGDRREDAREKARKAEQARQAAEAGAQRERVGDNDDEEDDFSEDEDENERERAMGDDGFENDPRADDLLGDDVDDYLQDDYDRLEELEDL